MHPFTANTVRNSAGERAGSRRARFIVGERAERGADLRRNWLGHEIPVFSMETRASCLALSNLWMHYTDTAQ
jgi:hypothetical protein